MSKLVHAAVALTVSATALLTPRALAQHDPVTPAEVAAQRLEDDATGALERRDGTAGKLHWIGVDAGTTIRNPDVTPTMAPAAAARAHLVRYGRAFGLSGDASELRVVREHTSGRSHVTIFEQSLDGVPVLASGVSVETDANGQLRSILTDTTSASGVPRAVVQESVAAATARSLARERHDGAGRRLTVAPDGRLLFDPAVLGAEPSLGRHSVWGFTVSAGPSLSRRIFVDDQTGGIVADIDNAVALDRAVCDNANVVRGSTTSCTAGFARSEGGAATGVTDVDRMYDELGAVSAFYTSVGAPELTTLLGLQTSGTRRLTGTVRYCEAGAGTCPMPNAFWFNQQMYTGAGFAVDDVVGHEMTHGVIEKYADLFYWGQSGAINEGIADVMGEQVDRSIALPGEPADAWLLGEQASGGAARSLKDPSASPYLLPDRTTSPLYSNDIDDNGGVHTNSGIVAKTFYLASQGGTFNGQTVTGIDGTDATTSRSGRLWWEVVQRLVPGSDFADLGLVLDQACNSLVSTTGFTASTCQQVHNAGLATELATTPSGAAQPADAPATCPAGRTPRVLLSSESDPSSFQSVTASNAGWLRNASTELGINAYSGHDSWAAPGSTPSSAAALRAAATVTPPAGQPAYLRFQQWRNLDRDQYGYYDMGTVEFTESAYGPLVAEAFPASAWVNGPTDKVRTGQGNPSEARTGFAGDSHGWVASRLDISVLAGKPLRPQFSLATDRSFWMLPWFLDDIEVYTCDLTPTPSASTSTSPSASASSSTSPSSTPTASATGTVTPTATTSSQPTGSATPTGGTPTATTSTSTSPTTPSPTASASSSPTAPVTSSSSPTPTTTTTTSPVPPGAPTGFTIQPAASALAVTLRWKPPTTTGSGITGYRVTRSDGAVWVYRTYGSVIHSIPGTTTLTYRIRTLGRSGSTSGELVRVVSARRLSLSAPPSVRAGTTLTLTGTLRRLPDGTALGGHRVTVRYLRSGSSTWRTLTTSTGSVVKATSSSTGKVVVRIPALRGVVSYRLFGAGFRGTSRSWLRVWSPARRVTGT